MRVTIRAASTEDAKAVSRLIRDSLSTPVSASDIAHGLARLCVNPRHRVFVAAVDDVVVGFLHICDFDSLLYPAPMKTIAAIAVSPSYRRVGIGKALMQRAERWARESGAGGILLEIHALREDSLDFFLRCGFLAEKDSVSLQKLFESDAL